MVYVVALCEIPPAPLTQQPAGSKPPVALPTPLVLAGKLKQYPWGSVLGISATGAAGVFASAFREQPLLDLPLGLFCVGAGILLERAVNYTIGREIDSRIDAANRRRDADRRLEALRDFQRKGLISAPDAHRLAGIIARRCVLGPPKPGKPRGSYHKHQKPAEPPLELPVEPPTEPSGPVDHPRPQRPAA